MAKAKRNDWNGPILALFAVIYGSLLILFGVQTWFFVNWLFPDDQLLMKCLTMLCFDVLALVWAVAHTFYRFRSRGAKRWTQIAWTVTFILSLLASILYLVIQSFFRFRIVPNSNYIYTGYIVSIVALVFNILAIMFVLIFEYRAANPRQDYFEDEEDEPLQRTQAAQPAASEQTFTKSDVQAMIAEALRREKVATAQVQQQDPKATAPLSTASQPGQANGKH